MRTAGSSRNDYTQNTEWRWRRQLSNGVWLLAGEMGQSNISSRLSRHIYAGQRASWAVALCFAAPITWFYLGLLSYWFAVIDRYRVFLYKHDMGPLAPGRMAAQRPWELLLLVLDGMALMLLLTAALGLERTRLGQASGRNVYILLVIVFGAAAGFSLLFLLTMLRLWRRLPMPDWGEFAVSGLCVAYLLVPLVHHTVFTDGYYYISDADNFSPVAGRSRSPYGLRSGSWLPVLPFCEYGYKVDK